VAGVEVVGSVDDVMAHVRAFDVSVAPLRIARGLQNKVLEAMAARRPVVLTSAAATGIAARHGEEFLVADRPGDIARCVASLLEDPPRRERIGEAARSFVASKHSWTESLRAFELIVTGVLERQARQGMRPRASSPVPEDGFVTGTPTVP
jgi:glycosyltransferase involved in cell wall biosynthesis